MTSPEKAAAFRDLLRQGWVSLLIDARRPGVSVPPVLAKDSALILQYGYDIPIQIPDLAVDAIGVSATLSFNRAPMFTYVSWSAVYGMRVDTATLNGAAWHVVDEPLFRNVDHELAMVLAMDSLLPVVAAPVEARRLTSVPASNDGETADGDRPVVVGPPALRVVK